MNGDGQDSLKKLVAELRRRHVFRVAGAYAVAVFAVLQLADIVLPALEMGDGAMRILIVASIVGFPLTVALAWLYDITRGGIVRTAPLDEGDGTPAAPAGAHPGPATPARVRRANVGYVGLGILVAIFGLGASVTFFPELTGPHAASPARAYATVPAERRIAVLPFENVGGAEDEEFFSDGMTEEIIGQLSRIDGLVVISRTSVMAYKGQSPSLERIGRELGVGRVLQGSVRYAGRQVRVSVELTDVAGGAVLWADRYDRTLDDVFRIQTDVATEIARTLSVELTPAVVERMAERPTTDTAAYTAYLRARHFQGRRTEDGLQRAIELFENAVARDSSFALAWTGLAESHLLLPQYGGTPTREALPRAREAARRALRLDPELAEPRASLGFIANNVDRDWETAEAEFRRAIELNPSYATAHHWYALSLLFHGRREDALVEIDQARQLDPMSVIVSADAGTVRRLAGRPEEALEPLAQALELDPDLPDAHLNLGLSYTALGWHDDARDALERAVYLTGRHPYALGTLGIVEGEAGRRERVREIAGELTGRAGEDEFVSPAIRGVLQGYLGDRDAMFDLLERADRERDLIFMSIVVDPVLARRFGADPRWIRLLARARSG